MGMPDENGLHQTNDLHEIVDQPSKTRLMNIQLFLLINRLRRKEVDRHNPTVGRQPGNQLRQRFRSSQQRMKQQDRRCILSSDGFPLDVGQANASDDDMAVLVMHHRPIARNKSLMLASIAKNGASSKVCIVGKFGPYALGCESDCNL